MAGAVATRRLGMVAIAVMLTTSVFVVRDFAGAVTDRGRQQAVAQGRGCRPPRGSVVRSSRTTIVFRGPPKRQFPHQRLTYACMRAVGRRLLLDLRAEGDGSVDPRTIRLRGSYIAYGDDFLGIDSDSEQVVVRDLRSGRVIHYRYPISPPSYGEDSTQLTALVLKQDGSVAWIASTTDVNHHPPPAEVCRLDRRGFARLDRGWKIGLSSLRLHGSVLSWKDSGNLRRSSLR